MTIDFGMSRAIECNEVRARGSFDVTGQDGKGSGEESKFLRNLFVRKDF